MVSMCGWIFHGFHITLNLNNASLFTIYHNLSNVRSRASVCDQATIIYLTAGDTIHVTSPDTTCIYGGNKKRTAFHGF